MEERLVPVGQLGQVEVLPLGRVLRPQVGHDLDVRDSWRLAGQYEVQLAQVQVDWFIGGVVVCAVGLRCWLSILLIQHQAILAPSVGTS